MRLRSRSMRGVLLILGAAFLMGCDLIALNPADDPAVSLVENASTPETTSDSLPTIAPTAATDSAPVATPTPADTPTPAPTLDPNLPKWTILVYMAADNTLDPEAIRNLNQMELAGGSDEVQIVVQIDRAASADWSDTRRYLILADEDSQAINSELLEEMGERNLGDPAELIDFVNWGRTSFPAQRTALIVWNHGIGWAGIATDDSDQDLLTLLELETALEATAAEEPLALIGFDACLMGQIDLYSVLAPYASIAVASEELTPGPGWPYDLWLGELVDDPDQTPTELAISAVDRFSDFYAETNPFTTLAAVDLSRISGVETALTGLLEAGKANPTVFGLARSGAEDYAVAYGTDAGRYSSIDLRHFASILTESVADPAIIEAAETLVKAVDRSVIWARHGRGFEEANGIALYFPGTAADFDPAYSAETPLQFWTSYLARFLTETEAVESIPPEVDLLHTTAGEPITALQPGHFTFQIVGRQIESVEFFAGRINPETGEKQLFERQPLIPEPTFLADGSSYFAWNDGLHEDFYIWSATSTVLSDGTAEQFVTFLPLSAEAWILTGIYQTSDLGPALPVTLVFNPGTGAVETLWINREDLAPYETTPLAGAVFTPDLLYLDAENALMTRPGQPMVFDEEGQLAYRWEPLPDGEYFVGLTTTSQDGSQSTTEIDVQVNPGQPELTGYLDPYLGFQFSYPNEWYRPVYRDRILFSTSPDGETALRITLFPEVGNITPQELKAEALAIFGAVQILYEENRTIDDRQAEVTAYGYETDAGGRTGLFAAFVVDGTGYVVDLDGPAAEEAALLESWTTLIDSWQTRPIGIGLFPNRWAQFELADLSIVRPEEFLYQPSDSGWERFAPPDRPETFVALRTETDTLTTSDEIDKWIDLASQGVDNFELLGDPEEVPLGRRVWIKQGFSYSNSANRTIQGFIMVSQDPNQGTNLIAWAEGLAAEYLQIERNIFEVMLLGIEFKAVEE